VKRSSAVIAGVLAVLCPPIAATTPAAGLDPSWRLGLSLVHLDGIHAGTGFVFTYGPLGFLGAPNIVWLPGAVLGLVYALVTAFVLYLLVLGNLRAWLPDLPAVALTVVFALLAASVADAPELATTALLLWSLSLVQPDRVALRLPQWVPILLGAVATMQLLVKTSVGLVAVIAAVIVCAARPARLRNLVVLFVTGCGSLVLWWALAGQPLANLGDWVRHTAQEASGYSAAMATTGDSYDRKFWVFLLVLVVAVAAMSWSVLPRTARSLPFVALYAVGAWFFVKEGFVRLDGEHLSYAFLSLALLTTALPFPRARMRAGLLTVVGAIVLTLLAMGTSLGSIGSTVRDVALAPTDAIPEVARVARATVQPGYRQHVLDGSAATIRAATPVPSSVRDALHGRSVHAEPWDISTVWAYGLRWKPVPVFQSYDAYTPALDDLNAEAFGGRHGPDAVLRSDVAIDGRVPAWESPSAMVRLTCDYDVVAHGGGWQALHRGVPKCGPARVLARRTVDPGATLRVPEARVPGAIVVATFDVPTTPGQRLLTLLVKPTRPARVVLDGVGYTFVPGTDSQPHLLHVPRTVDGRRVTNGGWDVRKLAFPDASGPVTVTFSELPPTRARR